MHEFLGEATAADRIRAALAATDAVVGSTPEVGDAIAAAL
jgi:hypothetical protein